MNIILFSHSEVQLPLPRTDPRARHILGVLRRRPGESFQVGQIDGPRGWALLEGVDASALTLSFKWDEAPAPLPPLGLIIGLPRPQTARDVLREGASLGIATIDFVHTERMEPGYATSSLWASAEVTRLLVAGAAQACCTRLPVVRHGEALAAALERLPGNATRVALDNYEAPVALPAAIPDGGGPVVLAVGAERGWTATERALLRRHGFILAHLGSRVLRTETACIAAVAIIKARRGWL